MKNYSSSSNEDVFFVFHRQRWNQDLFLVEEFFIFDQKEIYLFQRSSKKPQLIKQAYLT